MPSRTASFDPATAAACIDGLRAAWADCNGTAASAHGNLKLCYFTNTVKMTAAPERARGAACTASWECVDGLCKNLKCEEGTVRDVICVGPTPL